MQNRSTLPLIFPAFDGRQAAIKYWGKIGRPDLVSDVETQVELFRAHHEAKGSVFKSWHAAWRTWYIRAAQYSKPLSKPLGYKAPRSLETMKLTDYQGIAKPARIGPI